MRVPPLKSVTGRIDSFDGLRGIAAVVVVLFHYLCLLHPNLTPTMGVDLARVTHTPLHLLWNGQFAVAIFFVLSGYVMAAAADKRRGMLLVNCSARYLRMALPVTVSCLLAWLWLTMFPTEADIMKQTIDNPSLWLNFTHQHPIPPLWTAVINGMIGNFIRGYSGFNNVLWTMKFELFGSLGIFCLYSFTSERVRHALLLIAAVIIIKFLPDPYLAFVLGAGLFEAQRRGALQCLPTQLPKAALLGAVLMGSPGEGTHEQYNLPSVPLQWQVGQSGGLVSILAAALLLYSMLTLPALARILSARVPVFLGRISFGLYLVHVPPLYTIVAWSYLQGVPEPIIAALYACGTLALAFGFTLLVDEPVLRRVSQLRTKLDTTSADGRASV